MIMVHGTETMFDKKTIYIMHAKYIQTTEISVYTSSANVTLEIKDDGCHSFIKLSFHFPFLNQHKKNINFSLFTIETWAYFQGVIYLVIRALRTLFCSIFKTNSVFICIYLHIWKWKCDSLFPKWNN